MGDIQWTAGLAVHANQNNDIGNIGAPIFAMISLFSGAMFALLLPSFARSDSFDQ